MMTGKAEAYLRALARCWPPHPWGPMVPPFRALRERTRKYSIRHWRRRMREGMAIMMGTRYWPPHPRSGLRVAEPSDWKNMHRATKRSAIIFA